MGQRFPLHTNGVALAHRHITQQVGHGVPRSPAAVPTWPPHMGSALPGSSEPGTSGPPCCRDHAARCCFMASGGIHACNRLVKVGPDQEAAPQGRCLNGAVRTFHFFVFS